MNYESIPSAELLEKINSLNAYIYGLSSGKIYIGEISHALEIGIELNYPVELRRDESAKHGVRFFEAVPSNGFESMVISNSHIETQCRASLLIKKLYCDYLTSIKYGELLDEDTDNCLSDNLTTSSELEPKSNTEDYWKYIASRLKP